MSGTTPPPALVRGIGRWALTGLVINSIIGVAIFKLPAGIAAQLGGAAPWGYLLAAVLVAVLVAVFAELASQFADSGAAYAYARTAFGRFAGIQTGWFSWLARLAAISGIINAFVDFLGEWWPGMGWFERRSLMVLLVGTLTALNYRGLRVGVGFANIFTVAKLTALGLFIVGGLILVLPAPPPPRLDTISFAVWANGLVLLVYAFGGFESALIPAGEAKNPRRDAPFALYAGLAVVTLCYVLAHVVCMRALPNLAESNFAAADAARAFAGPAGAKAMAIGAMLSAFGTVSAAFVTAPRITFALAERGDFPKFFGAVHPRFRTPHVSIMIWAAIVLALSLFGGFLWNAVLSVAARLITYAISCAALIQLRRRNPQADAWRAPAGRLLAVIGFVFCAVLMSDFKRDHVLIISAVAVAATLNWAVARYAAARSSGRTGGSCE